MNLQMISKTHYLLLVVFLCVGNVLMANRFHVTTNGSSSGTGALNAPWTITHVFNHPVSVKAGDTIYVHGGTYKGLFTSNLSGSSVKPVVVMNYLSEIPIIDGNTGVAADAALTIKGSYTYYKGLHITNSNKGRIEGRTPALVVCGGVEVFGANNKLINFMIYDNPGNGIGFWSTAIDCEIHGCLIFNNGFQGLDRGHGHGIYTQNATGTKLMTDNVIFNGFQYGIHAYTEGGSIKGFNIDGNILFNNGTLQSNGTLKSNILIGGLQPADRVSIVNNHLFHNSGSSSKNLELGYSPINESVVVNNNTIIGGGISAMINKWKSVTFTGNTIAGNALLVGVDNQGVSISQYKWNNNMYYGAAVNAFSERTWDSWRSFTLFDANSTYAKSYPTQNKVIVRSNKYESGRAHLIVYNWQKLSTINVDVSTVLSTGANYKVYDIQNLKGTPVLTGKWSSGTISIPLGQTAVQLPNGVVPHTPGHTPIEFGVFLLTSDMSVTSIPNDPVIEDPVVKPVDPVIPVIPKEDVDPVIPVIPEDVLENDTVYTVGLITYYPNPTADIVAVEFTYDKSEKVVISVLNYKGEMVYNEILQTHKGFNRWIMNMAGFTDGFYVIRIGDGNRAIICKVLKQPHTSLVNKKNLSKDSLMNMK